MQPILSFAGLTQAQAPGGQALQGMPQGQRAGPAGLFGLILAEAMQGGPAAFGAGGQSDGLPQAARGAPVTPLTIPGTAPPCADASALQPASPGMPQVPLLLAQQGLALPPALAQGQADGREQGENPAGAAAAPSPSAQAGATIALAGAATDPGLSTSGPAGQPQLPGAEALPAPGQDPDPAAAEATEAPGRPPVQQLFRLTRTAPGPAGQPDTALAPDPAPEHDAGSRPDGLPDPAAAEPLAAALLMAAPPASGPAPAQAPPANSPESDRSGVHPAAGLEESPPDPAEQAFIARAIKSLTQGKPDPGPDAGKAPEAPRPTFENLVEMATARRTAPEAPDGKAAGPARTAQSQSPAPGADKAAARELPSVVPALPARQPAETGAAVAAPPQESAPAPRPAPDPEQVMRQVVRSIKVGVEGKRSEVRLQLQPEHLGPLTVRLTVTEGTLRANLTARDPAVKEMIESGLQQLKLRMEEHGIRVEQVHVSVGNEGSFGPSHQPSSQQQGNPGQEQPAPGRSTLRQGGREQGEPDPAEPRRSPAPSRPWSPRGTGARIDSLA